MSTYVSHGYNLLHLQLFNTVIVLFNLLSSLNNSGSSLWNSSIWFSSFLPYFSKFESGTENYYQETQVGNRTSTKCAPKWLGKIVFDALLCVWIMCLLFNLLFGTSNAGYSHFDDQLCCCCQNVLWQTSGPQNIVFSVPKALHVILHLRP